MLRLIAVLLSCQFTVEVVPSFTVSVIQEAPAGTPDSSAGSATPARSQKKCLTMFTASWCGPCQSWKRNVYPQLAREGYAVQFVDMGSAENVRKFSNRIGRYPTFLVTDYDTGKWLSEPRVGAIDLAAAKWMLDGPIAKAPEQVSGKVSQTPVRFIQWPSWGTIDLETYNRDCDCSMCQSIRVMQRDYKARKTSAVTPDQEGTPDDVVSAMLDSLQLQTGDVVADLGCGDGRVCIAAANRGFRAIGIEIDPARAEVARRKVQDAGVSELVTIEVGDALEFDTDRATVVTAYLYPPLLEKLVPRLKSVRAFASPYHSVPGLAMTKRGDVWIWKR